TGGSLGFQIGAQSTDIILVFKTRKGVENITSGKLTLGADASIAAGPVGRHTAAATDLQFKAEVYSYSRSRGLFAGVALEGAGVTMDRKSNAAFYKSPSLTPDQIFASSGNAAPTVANNFVQLLTAQTRRLPKQPGMETGVAAASPARSSTPPSTGVKTYGIADPDAASGSDDDYDSQEF
ncbi:MAG: lipid-binding SYLF domain-containing protein, partial [Gammaproteobacteria bacterium]|nr:lipid-binding SYLF domain-containing protein [Gammaproteobacteria bacterium]